MRMSSGSSRLKLKPRPSPSSCSELTPRIRQDAVHAGEASCVEHLAECLEIRVHGLEPSAERRQRLRGASERVGVPINPDHPVRPAFDQSPRVSAQPQRAIDEGASALRLQKSEDLLEQHRLVDRPAARGVRFQLVARRSSLRRRYGPESAGAVLPAATRRPRSAAATTERLVLSRKRHPLNPELRERACVVIAERLALELRGEALVVPHLEVVELADDVDLARHRGRVAQPRLNEHAAL